MIIRPFTPDDLIGLLSVQEKSRLTQSWKGEDYLRLSEQGGGLILVAEEGAGSRRCVVGFVASRRVMDHAELLNLAVDPDRRRSGIGKGLLLESCRQLWDAGVRSASLEVRASNKAAICLYYSVGFVTESVRKNYYTNPAEDAYVLALDLSAESE